MSAKPIKMKDYNLVINDNPQKDMREVILLQQKGEFNFLGASYEFLPNTSNIVIHERECDIEIENFPSQLALMIHQEMARLVILEVDSGLVKSMKGSIYFPQLVTKKREKTGGRKRRSDPDE